MKLAALKLRQLIPTEDIESQCLVQWAKSKYWQGKRIADALILNAGGAYLGSDARQRAITMGRLKRQGFKNGVFDFFLAIPRAGFGGLWIEMKRKQGGVVSNDQVTFQYTMTDLGYKTAICKGWEAAKEAIEEYLG
jgi:hypothetical protein